MCLRSVLGDGGKSDGKEQSKNNLFIINLVVLLFIFNKNKIKLFKNKNNQKKRTIKTLDFN